MKTCYDLPGRMRDLCSGIGHDGRPDPATAEVMAWRFRFEAMGIEFPKQEAKPRHIAKASPRSTCSDCTGGIERPSKLKQLVTAAAAIARFIGDGAKTTSEAENERRSDICSKCPLNSHGICNGCGCLLSAKTAMRLEECPAKKWHADIHAVRPIVGPVRNLIMHVLPVAANDAWKWNLEQVARRSDLFNGKRVLAIAEESKQQVARRNVKTVAAEEVLAFCESIGFRWTSHRVFPNNITLREVATFPWLLSEVCSSDPNEVTFSCHAKGVTHSMDSIVIRWADRQYRACLDDWSTVQATLERYSMAGAFRKFGDFATPGNHRWHYSGTNYWFRHDDVFSRDWRTLDQKFFGTESWPGRLFRPEECACLFADDAGDIYKESYWKSIERETNVWEAAR